MFNSKKGKSLAATSLYIQLIFSPEVYLVPFQIILDVSFTKNPVIKLPLIILPIDGPSVKALEAGLYPDLAKLNL